MGGFNELSRTYFDHKRIQYGDMSSAVFIVFCVVLSTEDSLICIGNTLTIYVFWKMRRTLKKASYLLINLAVADLLVGVMQIILLATQMEPYLFNYSEQHIYISQKSHVLSSIQIIFACSSVFSFAVISLERVYAVVWPLHHRTVSSRVYFSSIGFIWAAGTLYMLSFVGILSPTFTGVPINGTILSSLCVVCASYVIIRTRLRRTPLIFDNQRRRNMERNIKLSKTFFIVIGLSLACWVPATVTYTLDRMCENCISRIVMLVAIVLHLANPVVYCYRMPIFKEELKKCFEKCKFLRNAKKDRKTSPIGYFDTRL